MSLKTLESYQVLARKYRPQTFSELAGQEVLVQTLRNSIKHNKIAHAFVLTGIRGVGKTTTARIIAKSLNCLGEKGSNDQPIEPCNKCSNCLAISQSNFHDVVEIDAASRTGVDDMRAIIDSISYAPAIGRYKVYIIDEVHMLSNSAFNALLKTLEEPPAHTKFIFATTHIKKIPVTVLSRCQRFDLRRLSTEEISDYLAEIMKKENFEFEDESLSLIANGADGSMRDALSLLDRILSCNNYQKKLETSMVEQVMNLTDKSLILELFENLMKGDVKNSIDSFDRFYSISSDINGLIQDLLEVNHQITLYKSLNDDTILSAPKLQLEKIKDFAAKASLSDLTKIWQMLLKGLKELSVSRVSQKMITHMLLIRICHLNNLPNLEQVIKDVNKNKHVNNNTQNEAAQDNNEQDLSGELMRNFSNAKIV